MTETAFDLDEGCALLEHTPGILRAWLAGLPEPWVRATEGPETWSAFDVVAHLIDGEEAVWIPRARIILTQQGDRRLVRSDRVRQPGDTSDLTQCLDRFAALRAESLATLRGFKLTPEQLALRGEHPELGPVTLAQLLATWVAHDLNHLMQIARVMGKRYTAAVGPWTEFLRVVRS